MAANLGFLDYLNNGVLVLDEALVIRGVNRAFTNMFGYQAAEAEGQTCYSLFNCQHPPDDPGECRALCFFILPNYGPDMRFHNGLPAKNGQTVHIEGQPAPFDVPGFGFDTGGKFSLLILKDITPEMHREQLQTEFVAAASHQLRTPLASIKTAVGLLLDHTGPDFNPLLQRLLQNIQVSGLRLERIVNDLIELTNLQSGRVRLHIRPVAVTRLVEQAAELSQDLLAARQQHLKLELSPEASVLWALADYNRISQVLGHLLGNASKFSPPGSTVELKVRQGQDRTVVFSVRDEGIGISPEEQPFIFEKFYQVQSVENSTAPGGGLGLPLAKALIELHGGKFWFESQPGQGSTFSFSLWQAAVTDLDDKHELDK